jgi:hypothetical protein
MLAELVRIGADVLIVVVVVIGVLGVTALITGRMKKKDD